MTESEYIKASNRIKINTALDVLRGILTGDSYGISDKELGEITKRLCEVQNKLYSNSMITEK